MAGDFQRRPEAWRSGGYLRTATVEDRHR
jgi:hypothetical protein